MKKVLWWAGLSIGALILWWAALETADGAVGGTVTTAPGLASNDVAQISALLGGNSPLDFPFAGTTRHKCTVWQQTVTSGSSTTIFTASGRGVVREIQFVFVDNNAGMTDAGKRQTNFLGGVMLTVAVDGEGTPSVSVPLAHLIGWTCVDQLTTNFYQTPYFAVMDRPFQTNKVSSNLGTFGFTLKYAMPYTNGITVKLVGNVVTGLAEGYAADITWQDDLPVYPYAGLRFQVYTNLGWLTNQTLSATANASGNTVTWVSGATFDNTYLGKSVMIDNLTPDWMVAQVPDATHLTLITSDTASFSSQVLHVCDTAKVFNRPAGESGYIAAVFGGFSSRGDPDAPTEQGLVTTYWEANTRIFANQQTNDCIGEWAATEDFFTGDYYFGAQKDAWLLGTQTAGSQQDLGGVTSYLVGTGFFATNFSSAAYRLFKNCPVVYTNGCEIREPLTSDYGKDVARRAIYLTWTTVYYKFR